ncbi:MAG: DUF4442 domain-containing protein [Steroidobacteraceae bacterium]
MLGGIAAISSSGTAQAQLDWLSLTPTAPASKLLQEFSRQGSSLFGRRRFARLIAALAPASAWIKPHYLELRPGLCRLELDAMRELLRADGQLDPVAVGALCQVGALLVAEISIPKTLGWQLRGMTVEHLRPAVGSIEALTRLDRSDWRNLQTIALPITVSDATGTEVARAVVSLALGNLPGSESLAQSP